MLDKTKAYRFKSVEDKAQALEGEKIFIDDTAKNPNLLISWFKINQAWATTHPNSLNKNTEIVDWEPVDRKNLYLFNNVKEKEKFAQQLAAQGEPVCIIAQGKKARSGRHTNLRYDHGTWLGTAQIGGNNVKVIDKRTEATIPAPEHAVTTAQTIDKTKIHHFPTKEERKQAIGSDPHTCYAINEPYIVWAEQSKRWYGFTTEAGARYYGPKKEIVYHPEQEPRRNSKKEPIDREALYLFNSCEEKRKFAHWLQEQGEPVCSATMTEKDTVYPNLRFAYGEWTGTTRHTAEKMIDKRKPQTMGPCKKVRFDPKNNAFFEQLDPNIIYVFDDEDHMVRWAEKYWGRAKFAPTVKYKAASNFRYLKYDAGWWTARTSGPHTLHKPQIKICGLEWPGSQTTQTPQQTEETMETKKFFRNAAEKVVRATESSTPMEPMQNFGMRFTWAALWPVRILARTVGVSALNGARTILNAATFGGLCYGAYWLYNNVHINF